MRITRIIMVMLIGALLTLVACAPTAAPTTPAPTTPTTTTPATTPTPTPTPTQPAPAQPAPTPGTGPAAFTISDLKIEPEMPEPRDDVIVIVKVTNTGGQSGTYKVVLKVDGETITTQDVTLAAGASQLARLNFAAGPIGKYKVTVGNLTGELVVMDM